MVKGYLFRERIKLKKTDPIQILNSFDSTAKVNSGIRQINSTDKVKLTEYYSEDYHFFSYTFTAQENYGGVFYLYDTLSKALPSYLKMIKYSDKSLILAICKMNDMKEDKDLTLLIEELARIGSYLIGQNKDTDEIVEFIQGYVKLCVSTPESRGEI